MRIEGSKHLKEADYDAPSQTLKVTFHGGRIYHYDGVPAEKWDAFQESPSKGKYLHQQIIPHHRAQLQNPPPDEE